MSGCACNILEVIVHQGNHRSPLSCLHHGDGIHELYVDVHGFPQEFPQPQEDLLLYFGGETLVLDNLHREGVPACLHDLILSEGKFIFLEIMAEECTWEPGSVG